SVDTSLDSHSHSLHHSSPLDSLDIWRTLSDIENVNVHTVDSEAVSGLGCVDVRESMDAIALESKTECSPVALNDSHSNQKKTIVSEDSNSASHDSRREIRRDFVSNSGNTTSNTTSSKIQVENVKLKTGQNSKLTTNFLVSSSDQKLDDRQFVIEEPR